MPKRLEELASGVSLVGALAARAKATPDLPALSYLQDGESPVETISYATLDARARGVAAALRESGAPGDRVLLLHESNLDFVYSFLGTLYAQMVAVPSYSPERGRLSKSLSRTTAIVKDAKPTLALTTSEFLNDTADLLRDAGAELGWMASDELGEAPELDIPLDPAASAVAFLQYTSGSTGTPKGVVVTQGSMFHNFEMARAAWPLEAEGACLVSWLPLFHDLGLMANLISSIFAGAHCVLMTPLSFLTKPVRWLQAISKHRGTISMAPNFAYELCLRKVTEPERRGLDLSSWLVALNAAEPIRRDTVERFYETFRDCGLRKEAHCPGYGLAEAGAFVSSGRVQRPSHFLRVDRDAFEQQQLKEVPEGSPAPARFLAGCGNWTHDGQDVRIVDPESRQALPQGRIGEVWIQGKQLGQGYWNKPEATEEVFHARLADGSGPFLKTGDLGAVLDNELVITGRIKDLIIVRGQNVYPQDLELSCERAEALVRPGSVAAFALQGNMGDDVGLACEVYEKPGADFGQAVARIIQALGEAHEVHVCRVTLLKAGSVPKTSSGKIQRRFVREAVLQCQLPVVYEWIEKP
jgi:acyl-CoA synthetase (AMP-forming)/AMP-acid ligase II